MLEILGLPAHVLFLHAVVAFAPVEAHAAQGDRLEIAAVAFAVVVVLAVAVTGPWATSRMALLVRTRSTQWLVWALQAVTVLAGLFLVYQVVVTGHTGAQSVWSDWRTD